MSAPIPVLDAARVLGADAAGDGGVASDLVAALHTFGCVRLVGCQPAVFGASGSDLSFDAVFDASRRFFALDETVKSQYAYRGHTGNRGYIGFGKESHEAQAREGEDSANETESSFPVALFDRKETFDIGKEGEPGFETPWPRELAAPDFRERLLAYFRALDDLQLRLLRLLALGLGLADANFFVDQCNAKHCNLRLLHYPEEPMEAFGTGGCNGSGASSRRRALVRGARHTDFGTLTLLLQDGTGGLRLQVRSGDWLQVDPVPDSLIVQAGDMLERWTGGALRAVPHQVVQVLSAPNDGGSSATSTAAATVPERFSVAFFCNANKDVTIETLELPAFAGTVHRYEPVNAMEYLTRRLEATIDSAADGGGRTAE